MIRISNKDNIHGRKRKHGLDQDWMDKGKETGRGGEAPPRSLTHSSTRCARKNSAPIVQPGG